MIVVIDNYDSFTYNLVQRLGEIDPTVDVRVVRNDEVTPQEIEAMGVERLLISPGPCTPTEAGISVECVTHFMGKVPVLGVCLGHQSITEVFGGKVVRNSRLMHGKTSPVNHDGLGVFAGMPQPMLVGRYHSLVAKPESLPACLQITATTAEGEIMGLRHTELVVEGVQFHPESVLTPEGPQLLGNFLRMQGGVR